MSATSIINRSGNAQPQSVAPTDRQGFTLVESLIAATILAASVVALVAPFSLAAKQQQVNAAATTAAALAEQMIERAVALNYDDALALDGTSESGRTLTDSAGQSLNDDSLAGFARTVQADEVAIALPGEDLKDAAVFCRFVVTVSHADIPDVVYTRLIARD